MRGLQIACAALAPLMMFGTVSPAAAQTTPSGNTGEESVPVLSFGDDKKGMLGEISAWALYSSEFGATGGASGKFKLSPESGKWFSLGGEVAQKHQSAKLAYHQDDVLANGAALDLILRGEHQEPRDILPFDIETAGIEARLGWGDAKNGAIAAYLGYAQNRLYNPGPDFSDILTADLGTHRRSYVGAEYSRTLEFDGALSKLRYEFGAEIASLSEDRTQGRLRAQILAGGLLANDAVMWRVDLRGGVLETSGGASSIGDRYILGGATLRGFSYGGFGPHDGTQTLGGNRYAAARVDVQFPRAFGKNAWLLPGLHADVGSLWSLDNTGNGAVDDSSHLRSSVGITLATKIAGGALSFSASKVIESQPDDDTQPFQIRFDSKF